MIEVYSMLAASVSADKKSTGTEVMLLAEQTISLLAVIQEQPDGHEPVVPGDVYYLSSRSQVVTRLVPNTRRARIKNAVISVAASADDSPGHRLHSDVSAIWGLLENGLPLRRPRSFLKKQKQPFTFKY